MKRQIKFKGKSFVNGKWVYGDLLHIDGGYIILHEEGEVETLHCDNENIAMAFTKDVVSVVFPDSIGQFTGLTDKNGKEIYEGDIFTVKGKYPRVILWDKVSWAAMPCEHYHGKQWWVMNLQHPGNDWWEEFADEIEIIGNRFDNPELFKEE